MKDKIASLKNHRHYNKVMHWGKLVSITGSGQIIVQVLGFVCGILIIRLMSVQEYAFYTLANTMLSTMVVLSDGGISAGVMAQGGKVWQDKEKLGVVLATGLDLRRKFALISLSVSIPILFYLLMRINAGWITSLLIAASLVPAFYAALSDSLLEIIPKLHQKIPSLQKNQISVASFRLFLTGFMMFFCPWSFMAIVANGIPRIYGNINIRKIAYNFADKNQNANADVRKEILLVVKRIMPGSLYFAFNGQITIWLLAMFGTSTSLAQIGALGRFSVVFAVISSMSVMLISPYFAKISDKDLGQLRFKFYGYLLLLISFVVLLLVLTNIFSDQVLEILGSSYKNLNVELMLVLISSGLSIISGVSFSILSSRGWPTPPVFIIVGNLLFVVAGLLLFDIRLLRDVLYFNIFTSCFPVLLHSSYFYYKTKSR